MLAAWLCRLLYRVEVEGRHNIPATGGYLLVSNHESSIDAALVALATERPIRFIARAELWRPGLRGFFNALGGIPIRRGKGDQRALRRAIGLLERGELVAIFPQGTIRRFKERRYRRGAARIALATNVPVIPIRLIGSGSAFSLSPPRVGLPKLRVVVGRPIQVVEGAATRTGVDALTATVESAIERLEPRAP